MYALSLDGISNAIKELS